MPNRWSFLMRRRFVIVVKWVCFSSWRYAAGFAIGWTAGMVGFYLAFEVVGPMLP